MTKVLIIGAWQVVVLFVNYWERPVSSPRAQKQKVKSCLIKLLNSLQSFNTMAATERHEQEMKQKSAEAAKKATDPLEILRHNCLARGASGIKGLGRLVSFTGLREGGVETRK